jgi:hypothetical protein
MPYHRVVFLGLDDRLHDEEEASQTRERNRGLRIVGLLVLVESDPVAVDGFEGLLQEVLNLVADCSIDHGSRFGMGLTIRPSLAAYIRDLVLLGLDLDHLDCDASSHHDVDRQVGCTQIVKAVERPSLGLLARPTSCAGRRTQHQNAAAVLLDSSFDPN